MITSLQKLRFLLWQMTLKSKIPNFSENIQKCTKRHKWLKKHNTKKAKSCQKVYLIKRKEKMTGVMVLVWACLLLFFQIQKRKVVRKKKESH